MFFQQLSDEVARAYGDLVELKVSIMGCVCGVCVCCVLTVLCGVCMRLGGIESKYYGMSVSVVLLCCVFDVLFCVLCDWF